MLILPHTYLPTQGNTRSILQKGVVVINQTPANTYICIYCRAHPLVIAAHPSESNQFALGLNDGSVYLLEPLESEGKWGTSPPVENGAGPSNASGAPNAATDQTQR